MRYRLELNVAKTGSCGDFGKGGREGDAVYIIKYPPQKCLTVTGGPAAPQCSTGASPIKILKNNEIRSERKNLAWTE